MTLPSSLLIISACIAMAGCQRTPSRDATPATGPSGRTSAQPAELQRPISPPTEDSAVAYACDDGRILTASYGVGNVTLHWPDGRSVTLPRAESASKGGGDVYVGETVSLQRDGDHIQLHDGDAPATACTASGDGA